MSLEDIIEDNSSRTHRSMTNFGVQRAYICQVEILSPGWSRE
jgi:hypothetical protein